VCECVCWSLLVCECMYWSYWCVSACVGVIGVCGGVLEFIGV